MIAATDYTAYALLPCLTAHLAQQAPHLRIKMVYATQQASQDDLKEGRIHFALSVTHSSAATVAGLQAHELLTGDYVVVARNTHPRIGDTLSLEHYLAERHVRVLPTDDSVSAIDLSLGHLKLHRDIAVELPSLMAAPFIIAATDYLLTLPSTIARQLVGAIGLRAHQLPFEAPQYAVHLLYHPRQARSRGHNWMREMIVSAMGSRQGG